MARRRRKNGARAGAALLLLAVLACSVTQEMGPGASDAVHEVRPGDTLTWIAAGYGVDLERLALANGISDVNRIEVGRRLVIPGGARIVHVVKPGETLQQIAGRYRVPVSTIHHGRGDPWRVAAGERLVLPREATLPPPPRRPPARADDRALGEATALLDDAEAKYRDARFEEALDAVRTVDRRLDGRSDAGALRARAAFLRGSALAGLGDEEGAVEAFGGVRAHDPSFEPPPEWLSPRLEALYERSQPR